MDEHLLITLDNVLGSCFMPPMTEDCLNVVEHYKEYMEGLCKEFHNIMEILKWVENATIAQMKELQLERHARLLILLYEVGNPRLPLKIPSEIVTKSKEVIEKLHWAELFSSILEQQIFDYYRRHLDKDGWKTQFGAMHGFQYYLTMQSRIQQPLLSLSLAIGLSIHNHHEIYYKNLSVLICQDILEKSDSSTIVDMNIHLVIYDAFLNDLYKLDNAKFLQNVCKCLYKCLLYYTNTVDSKKWSVIDDVEEIVLRNIMLANHIDVGCVFLEFINKLGLFFHGNRNKLSKNLRNLSELERIYDIKYFINLFLSHNQTNYMILRWTKKIFEILESQISLCMQQQMHAKYSFPLQESLCLITKCYMIYVLPIPLSILETHIKDFYNRIINYLMQIANHKRIDDKIIKIITHFLDIVYHQHDMYFNSKHQKDEQNRSTALMDYMNNLQKLLLISPFNKYSRQSHKGSIKWIGQ